MLDRWIPELKDTELRLMLILIRQTFGWHSPTAVVRLSFAELTVRTGRKKSAVVAAVASLEARGLIHTVPPSQGPKNITDRPSFLKDNNKQRQIEK